jgi:hypothetical protein
MGGSTVVVDDMGGSTVVEKGGSAVDVERSDEENLEDVRLRGLEVVKARVHFTGYVSRQDRSFGWKQ